MFREALVHAASTPNGVWSVKIVTSVVDLLPQALTNWGIGDGISSAWLAELFQSPAVLVLRRRDRIAQAVSWWRALATGCYLRERGTAEAPCPPYEFNALREALTVIEAFNAKLHELANALAALPDAEVAWCDYEDALVAPRRPLEILAQMSGVDLGNASIASDLEIQRDTSSINIIERFRTALEMHGVGVIQDSENSQQAPTEQVLGWGHRRP